MSRSALIAAVQATLLRVQQAKASPGGNELEIATKLLDDQRVRIDQYSSAVSKNVKPEIIDPDSSIHDLLELVKEFCREIRNEIVPGSSYPTVPALSDTYTAANRLQWAIAEHDASNAPRGRPLLVTNQIELDQALDQILAEK